jgi:RNA polymerase sigma factor (sigma-70 family)
MCCPPSPNEPSGFEALIAQIAGGSDAAVWELLDRYSSNILRVVRRQLPAAVRSKVDSADVVQSVWKSMLRNPSRLKDIGDAKSLIAYLAGTAQNKVNEIYRRFTAIQAYSVHREFALPLKPTDEGGQHLWENAHRDRGANTASSIASARETWNLAVQKEGKLGRQIVRLRLQGLTHRQIAEKLNIGESSVRRVFHSMLQSLTT